MPVNSVVYVDTCADLPVEVIEQLGINSFQFPYVLDGVERLDDFGRMFSRAEFYAAMRNGHQPTTMQVPRHVFVDTFRRHAEAGEPLLYLAFTSALSGTFDVAWMARQEVLDEFPDAEIRLVDTQAASIAEGLIVYEAIKRWRTGMPIEEVERWVLARRPYLNGWFIVDDLETLRRGGRLPGAAAAAGTLLDVKPLLRLADSGKLEVRRSIRGRLKCTKTLADIVAERAIDPAAQTMFVGHGDCLADAERLRDVLVQKTGVNDVIIAEIGPVIGSHTGPGMLAVVFWGQP